VSKLRPPAEIAICLTLAGVFFLYGFAPAWRSMNTDFSTYYVTARLYREGHSLARVYEWIWFQRQKNHAGMERRVVGFFPLTGFSAMPIVPLTTLSPLAAKRCWIAINLLLLGFTGFLLYRMTALGTWQAAILVFLATQPLRTHFLYGQFHLLVLFLVVLSLWLYLKGRPVGSGVRNREV
jgi:hypothetical protein